MVRPLLLTICLLLSALPLRAQDQKFDLFGGYQFTNFQVFHGFAASPPKSKGNGWNAAVAYHFNRWLAAKADLSNSYGSGGTQLGVSNGPASLITYTFGPTFSAYSSPKGKLFGEVLVGGYSNQVQYFASESFHGLALMAGGGIDAQVGKRFAVRVLEVDWLGFMTGYGFFNYGTKSNFRVSTGLVFQF